MIFLSSLHIDIARLYTPDILIFFGILLLFAFSRYLLDNDIQKKKLNKDDDGKKKKKKYVMSSFIATVTIAYLLSLYFDIAFLTNIVRFSFSIFLIYIITLFVHRKVLILYGEEIEVSWQTYFRKGYKANIFSLFINGLSILIGIFLFIQIFELNTFIEIGGLWAGILAFMWFTAPVWALDMIAGIILLHSRTLEVGNVVYIYETWLYAWIKNISLTEVKMIDLRTSNPIVFRPSGLRNLTIKNLSQWIAGKTQKVLRDITINIDYKTDAENLQSLCYEAFDIMLEELKSTPETNYFWEEPYKVLEIEKFADYSVTYKFFYTITSPFYIFKAERLLNSYLLRSQKKYNLYFSTPDLLTIKKESE